MVMWNMFHSTPYPIFVQTSATAKIQRSQTVTNQLKVKQQINQFFDAQQRFSINMQTCERNFSGLPKWPGSEFANYVNTRHIEKVLLLHIELVRPFCSCYTYRRYCSWFIWLNSPVAIQRHYAYKPLRIINIVTGLKGFAKNNQ